MNFSNQSPQKDCTINQCTTESCDINVCTKNDCTTGERNPPRNCVENESNKSSKCHETCVLVTSSSSYDHSTVKRRKRRNRKRKRNIFDQNQTNKHKSNKQKPKKSTIVNISDKILSQPETTLLEKGLNFCPTKKTNPGDQRKELDQFHRSLRIKQFFNKDQENSDPSQPTIQFLGQAFKKQVPKMKSYVKDTHYRTPP